MEKSKHFVGWKGICSNEGKFVAPEDGFEYVCDQVGIFAFNHDAPDALEFAYMMLEWYFSSNWIEVYEEDEDG